MQLLKIIILVLPLSVYALEATEPELNKPAKAETSRVPFFSTFFHGFGENILGTITYGYGVPWAMAAAGTYGFIQSGIDWKWNRFCVRHEKASNIATIPGGLIGTFAPFIIPLAMYFKSDNPEIQITGLAIGQAALLGLASTTFIKAFTGRTPPHVTEAADGDVKYQKDYSDDFKWGFMRGGVFNGWPSGHTTTAVAMATTLATMYPDNMSIRIGAIAYSAMIGISMSFMAHWSSDIFAGVFAGYAIGRTVGKNFAKLLHDKPEDKVSFFIYPNGAELVVHF